MKTGRDANQPGSYTSECCLVEINVTEGQMLPRCPACNALTVWGTQGADDPQDRHTTFCVHTVIPINLFPREFPVAVYGPLN